jgi:hypothetical protein
MSQITIQGYTFTVPEGALAKFSVGSTLTLDEGTASTLQQVTCENLRNNFASKVKKEINGGEATEAQLAELQKAFEEYATAYSFGVRQARGPGSPPIDPVEKEARKLASADLAKAYKARHGSKLDKERLEIGVDNLMSNKGDDYMKRARNIIRERNRVSEDVLANVEGL